MTGDVDRRPARSGRPVLGGRAPGPGPGCGRGRQDAAAATRAEAGYRLLDAAHGGQRRPPTDAEASGRVGQAVEVGGFGKTLSRPTCRQVRANSSSLAVARWAVAPTSR